MRRERLQELPRTKRNEALRDREENAPGPVSIRRFETQLYRVECPGLRIGDAKGWQPKIVANRMANLLVAPCINSPVRRVSGQLGSNLTVNRRGRASRSSGFIRLDPEDLTSVDFGSKHERGAGHPSQLREYLQLSSSLLTNAIKILRRANENLTIRDRRRTKTVIVQGVLREHLKFRPRPDHRS